MKINKWFKRNMKKVIAVLSLLLVIELVVAYVINSPSRRFVRCISRGLNNSWACDYNENNLRNKETGWTSDFIDAEYEAVSGFKGDDYDVESLKKDADDYIAAIEGCKSVLEKYKDNDNFDAFWAEFSTYYGQRITALYNIYKGGYGLTFETKMAKNNMANICTNAWAIKKSEKIKFEKTSSKKSVPTYTATVKNDSGFNLDYINYEIDLVNKKGKTVDVVSAYASDIKKNDEFSLTFYVVGGNVKGYRIVNASCYKKQN